MNEIHESYLWYVKNAPRQAVSALRHVHETGDAATRFAFARDFIDPRISDAQWKILIETGLPELLLDILSEDTTYQFIDPPPPGEQDEVVNLEAIVSAEISFSTES